LSAPLIVIAVFLVVSVLLPFPDAVRATEVIADNFNDMDYAGWNTHGRFLNKTAFMEYYPGGVGNFSAADQTLKVIGPSENDTFHYLSMAYINSSICYGTWSFDVFVVNNTLGWCFVQLIGDSYNPKEAWSNIPGPYKNYSYEIWIYTRQIGRHYIRPTITLERCYDGLYSLEGEYGVLPTTATWTNCWNHIDVTRNSTGYFNVYLNGTRRISVQDTVFPISGYFAFEAQSGWAIDNVAILDYIVSHPPPETTPPPPPPPNLTTLMIAIGTIELIIIIVLAILYLRRRS
jgi:hypothetical protein